MYFFSGAQVQRLLPRWLCRLCRVAAVMLLPGGREFCKITQNFVLQLIILELVLNF